MIIILGIIGCIVLPLFLIKWGYSKKDSISWGLYISIMVTVFALVVAVPVVWGAVKQDVEITKSSFGYQPDMELSRAEIDKAVLATSNGYKIMYFRYSTKDTVATHFTIWPIYVHRLPKHTWKVEVYKKKPYNW